MVLSELLGDLSKLEGKGTFSLSLPKDDPTLMLDVAQQDKNAAIILQFCRDEFPDLTSWEIIKALLSAIWWLTFIASFHRDEGNTPNGGAGERNS